MATVKRRRQHPQRRYAEDGLEPQTENSLRLVMTVLHSFPDPADRIRWIRIYLPATAAELGIELGSQP